MISRFFRRRRPAAVAGESAADRAGRLFDAGMNCAQSVLQATTGTEDRQLLAMADAFGCGIGGSRCLCGAVSGGVMALGLEGKQKRAARLVRAFKERNKVTCCSALSRPYQWNSKEHRANCRRITAEAAEVVERLLRG